MYLYLHQLNPRVLSGRPMPLRSVSSSPPAAVRWVPCRAKRGSSGTPPGASPTNGTPWGWWCGPKAERAQRWDKGETKMLGK